MTKKAKTAAVAGLLFLFALALGLGWVSDWYRNWNFKSWFNYWGNAPKAVKPVEQDDVSGAGFIVSEIQNSTAMTLNAVRSVEADEPGADEASYTLTATYSPIGIIGESTKFEWTVAWSNPESEWAKDKSVTDYITVEANEDNTALVTCLQAFGEQAVVTVGLANEQSVSASCTVDYKLKLLDSMVPGGKIALDYSKYFGTISTKDKVVIVPGSSVRTGLPSSLFRVGFNNFIVYTKLACSNAYTILPTAPFTMSFYAQLNDSFVKKFRSYTSDYSKYITSFKDRYYVNKNPIILATTIGFDAFSPKLISTSTYEWHDQFMRSDQLLNISLFSFMDKLFPAWNNPRGFLSEDGAVDDTTFFFLDEYFYYSQRYYEEYSDDLDNENAWHFKVIMEVEFDGVVHTYEKKVLIKYNFPVTVWLDTPSIVF